MAAVTDPDLRELLAQAVFVFRADGAVVVDGAGDVLAAEDGDGVVVRFEPFHRSEHEPVQD